MASITFDRYLERVCINKQVASFIGVIFLGILMWNINVPDGLAPRAWQLFTIFICTIFSIILKPLPMGSIAFIAISLCTITNTLTISESLSSFSSKTVWLVLSAFLLARAFTKTGLGARLAYFFVYCFGRNTFGLGYALVAVDLILAPFIPSNTARGAGIIYPIVTSLKNETKNYLTEEQSNSLSKYLILLCFHANIITSAMFLTAMAANPLIAVFAETFSVSITWFSWFKAAIVPGSISLLTLPIALYFISNPKVVQTPKSRNFAKEKLDKMGPLTPKELIMIVTFVSLLFLWVTGSAFKIDATSAAFFGISILLVCNVINLDDILAEKAGWNAFIWLATLLMMTMHLSELGFINWVGSNIHSKIAGFDWKIAFVLTCLFYFYSHYLFASLIAHITTMYATFLLILKMIGAPMEITVYLLAFLSSLCACLTHFGTGTAPVFFGANTTTVKQWWSCGFMLSLSHIIIWGGLGLIWLKYALLF